VLPYIRQMNQVNSRSKHRPGIIIIINNNNNNNNNIKESVGHFLHCTPRSIHRNELAETADAQTQDAGNDSSRVYTRYM